MAVRSAWLGLLLLGASCGILPHALAADDPQLAPSRQNSGDRADQFERSRDQGLAELAELQFQLGEAERRLSEREAEIEGRLKLDRLQEAELKTIEREIEALARALPTNGVGEADVAAAMDAANKALADILQTSLCRPLRHKDVPDLVRRVLSLPGARLHEFAGAGPRREELPTFSVLHVFEEARDEKGDRWLRVGPNLECHRGSGWVKAAFVEDWKTMLVMQFAPRGSRERVLFYRDPGLLEDAIFAGFAADDAWAAYDEIAAGSIRDDRLVAVEPKTAMSFSSQPFLMPILDWRPATFIDGEQTTLVQVAGLSASRHARRRTDLTEEDMGDIEGAGEAVKGMRIGVKFVIDTTISMQPYIDETYAVMQAIVTAMQREGLLRQAGFGLVAYRDNVSPDPRIGYVTDVVRRLDDAGPAHTILDAFTSIGASPVPTKDWNEDAFAGLRAAIVDDDWDRFDARFVILVTDAGARPAFDPMASYLDLGVDEVVHMAKDRHIAIIPIHLLTPKGAKQGNHQPTTRQYRELGRTGDANTSKYVGILAGDRARFRKAVEGAARRIAQGMADIAAGKASTQGSTVPVHNIDPNDPGKLLNAIVTNELFRAQLEYLGRRQEESRSGFYRAWAADRDLTDPYRGTLDVKVFLSRNELNALAKGLAAIIDAERRHKTSPKDFFRQISSLSAVFAVEGGARDQPAALGDLLPAFLRALPYRSKILKLTLDDWIDLGGTGRDQLISALRAKQTTYRDMNANDKLWRNFNSGSDGGGDPATAVTPVPLDLLP